MSLISSLDRIQRINTLIRFRQTGTPEEFSRKLNVSRSMLYKYIKEIAALGAEIKYCRVLNSFIYNNEFSMNIIINR